MYLSLQTKTYIFGSSNLIVFISLSKRFFPASINSIFCFIDWKMLIKSKHPVQCAKASDESLHCLPSGTLTSYSKLNMKYQVVTVLFLTFILYFRLYILNKSLAQI